MARFATILGINFRNWVSARGVVLVTVAAFFPLLLTGAWVGTHQSDLAATAVTWEPSELVENQNATFMATLRNTGGATVGPFNASLSVGQVFGSTLRADKSETTRVESLAPGATTTLTLTWTPRPGVYWALAYADSEDVVGELEETNNQKPVPLLVKYAVPEASAAPAGPANLGGDANATQMADLAVTSLDWDRTAAPEAGKPVTLRATFVNNGPEPVTNATAVVRVARTVGASLFGMRDTTQGLDLAPGASQTLEVTWDAQQGAYWAEATIASPGTLQDADTADNRRIEALAVQPALAPDAAPPEPPAKQTIKEFYLNVLVFVYLPILIPFVALFYAAGVLADDREGGNLVYLLTRPVSRLSLPVSKFLAGSAVAATAVVIGLVATYTLLIGFTSADDIGFLTTPILVSLVALLVYGALFTALGIVVERPYLAGLAFVLGWETVAGAFLPWVKGLTVRDHVLGLLCVRRPDGTCDPAQGWAFVEGVQWLPEGPGAMSALMLLAVLAVAGLAIAAYLMKQKEFPE